MPRPLRIQYPGATYHVMCRGNRGAVVFAEDADARLFLRTVGEGAERAGFLVHAYTLMSTHYHLLLETPEGNLVESMKWVQGTFTQRHNALHRNWGHLFQGRYKAKLIEEEDPRYLGRVAMYIHLNPAAAGLAGVKGKKGLLSYRWSSLPQHVGRPSQRPPWLMSARVLGCEGMRDTPSGRRAYRALVENEARALGTKGKGPAGRAEWAGMERGWYHGSKAFRDLLLEHLAEDECLGALRADDAQQQRERSEHAAEAFVRECLDTLELRERDLPKLKKGDERKLLIAGLLSRHYPVSRAWIAGRLHLGHRSRVTEGARLTENPPPPLRAKKKELQSILQFSG